MSGMTDERWKELWKQCESSDPNVRLILHTNETLKECLEEIDQLRLEVDTLTQQEEAWGEENRKARELLLSAGQWLVCDSDYAGNEIAELSSEIEDYLKC